MTDMILTEEEQMLQNLVRDFADRELAPRAKEIDEREEFSWENWKGMSGLGLTGISVDPPVRRRWRRLPADGYSYLRSGQRRRLSQCLPPHPRLFGYCHHPKVRQRRPTQAIYSASGGGKEHRRLGAHRTERRLRRRCPENHGRGAGRHLLSQRLQDVHHQRRPSWTLLWSLRPRTPPKATEALAPLWSRRTPPASRSIPCMGRWGCGAPAPASWCSRILRRRPRTGLGRKDKGSVTLWISSTPAA